MMIPKMDSPVDVAYMIAQTLLKPDAGHIACEDFIQRSANAGFHTLSSSPRMPASLMR